MTLQQLEDMIARESSAESGATNSDDEDEDDIEGNETLETFMAKYGRELTPKQVGNLSLYKQASDLLMSN